MPGTQSITTKPGPAKKWAPLAVLALFAEGTALSLNAGIPLPVVSERALAALGVGSAHARDAAASSSAAVGQLVSSRGPLKFRARGSPVWQDPPADGLLRAGQSLRTLEHGSATVALFDGSTLTLEENSRIELDNTDANAAKIDLSLVSGSVHRRLAEAAPRRAGYRPSIEISAPEAGIAVPPDAQFSLRRSEDETGKLELRVLDGELGLRASTGSFLLKPGEEAVEAGSPNGFEFRKMPFVLLSPHAAQTVDAAKARFEWNVDPALTGGGPLEVQLAQDPGFERIIRTARIAATEPPLRHVTMTIELPPGDAGKPWYWRVHALTDATLASYASTFWLPATTTAGDAASGGPFDSLPRPRLKLPLESAVAFADKTLELVWGSVPGASAYEVDIEGRDQPVVTSDLGVAVNGAEIPLGRRIWRVRARLASASVSPWSDPRAFNLVISPDAPRRPASSSSAKGP